MPTTWPFRPNGINETITFSTDVRMSSTGESRESLHDAVTVLNFSYIAEDQQATEAQQLISENLLGEWYVPIWPDFTLINGDVTAGVTAINVNTDADYRAGGKAIISTDDQFEIVDVVSAAAGVLTCSAVANSYVNPLVAPVGTFLAPGGLQHAFRMTKTDQTVVFYRIDPRNLEASAYPTFETYDVVNDPPQVTQPLSGSISRKLDFIQNGFGSMDIEEIDTYSRWRGSLAFIDLTAETRWARREWIHRARGRDRPFWLPTWKPDLTITLAASTGSSILNVKADTSDTSKVIGRRIAIERPDGVTIYRRIIAAVLVGNEIALTLDQAHGIALSTNARVSWLRLVRFDTDAFELSHQFKYAGFTTSFSASVIEVPE